MTERVALGLSGGDALRLLIHLTDVRQMVRTTAQEHVDFIRVIIIF